MNDTLEKKGVMTHKRIDAIKAWLREEGAVEGANLENASRRIVSEAEAERLGKELLEEVRYAWKRDVDIDRVNELIRNGANMNLKGDGSLTALWWASRNGHEEVVEMLIRNGADVNLKNGVGWTALICASFYGKMEVVKVLIHGEAEVNLKDNKGKTAMDYASNKDIKKLLEEATSEQK